MDRAYLVTLKSRLRLSDVVGTFTKLTRRGGELWGCCPFHQEKTPSFKVNDARGTFHCFGCSAHGDVFAFLADKKNLSFMEAVREAAERVGMPLPERQEKAPESVSLYAPLQKATELFQQSWNTSLGKEAQRYCQTRGILPQSLKVFAVGVTPYTETFLQALSAFSPQQLTQSGLCTEKEQGLRPHFLRRLMFPLRESNGKVIGFGGRTLGHSKIKYINSAETSIFSKKNYLYGLYEASQNPSLREKPVILVEGYLDVIALQSAGLARAVAPLGTAVTTEQLERAWRMDKKPCLCFDGDEAGLRAMLRTAELALPHMMSGRDLQIVLLPKGEDPQSLIQGGRRAFLEEKLASPIPLSHFLLRYLKTQYDFRLPASATEARQRVRLWLGQMRSQDMRQSYKHFFWKSLGGQNDTQVSPLLARPSLSKDRARLHREQVVMLVCLRHPRLLTEHIEVIGALDLITPALRALQKCMLAWAAAVRDVPRSDDLKQDLVRNDLHDTVQELEDDRKLSSYAEFVNGNTNFDVVEEGFWDLLQSLTGRDALRRDILDAKKDFAQNVHGEAWCRLKKLQRALYVNS